MNYHLNVGASHIVACFDDPDDPVANEYGMEPRVTCIKCDDSHWKDVLGRPPKSLGELIDSNFRFGIEHLRKLGIDWILSLDGDELLYAFDGTVATNLGKIGKKRDLLTVRPLEAAQYSGFDEEAVFAPEYFKIGPWRASALQRTAQEVLHFRLRHLTKKGGFFGHIIGKQFVRSLADIDIYRHHRPRNSKVKLNKAENASLVMLHYDCNSYGDWVEKWEKRIFVSVPAPGISDDRKAQVAQIERAMKCGEPAIRRLFQRWHYWSRAQLWLGMKLGILRKIHIPRRMFEPASPIDKATAQSERWTGDHTHRI